VGGVIAASPNGADRKAPETLRYVGFNQLRSFHAVAHAGSVTKAAQMLHLSQPTVTIQLRQLESAYRVELVHRTPKGLQLTDIGRALFALSERIFALEQEAVSLLTKASGVLTGELRVGGVGPYFVMRLFAAFSEAYPAIQLSLALNNSEEVIKGLREYRTDVGLVGQPAGHPAPEGRLCAVPYSRQNVVLFVHRDHRWAKRDGIELEELADEPLILRESGSVSRRALEEALAAAEVQVNPALEVSREGVWEAVAAGLGAGITTDVEFPRDKRLHMLHILDADVATDAWVISLRERQEAPLVKAFMNLAAEMADGIPDVDKPPQ
jgi:LysR family transcriptional regulator, low CO2-responsive transcriptional regulator